MTKYRSFVNELDQTFKMDGGMAYKFLTFHTLVIVGLCVESILLDLGVIVM